MEGRVVGFEGTLVHPTCPFGECRKRLHDFDDSLPSKCPHCGQGFVKCRFAFFAVIRVRDSSGTLELVSRNDDHCRQLFGVGPGELRTLVGSRADWAESEVVRGGLQAGLFEVEVARLSPRDPRAFVNLLSFRRATESAEAPLCKREEALGEWAGPVPSKRVKAPVDPVNNTTES